MLFLSFQKFKKKKPKDCVFVCVENVERHSLISVVVYSDFERVFVDAFRCYVHFYEFTSSSLSSQTTILSDEFKMNSHSITKRDETKKNAHSQNIALFF